MKLLRFDHERSSRMELYSDMWEGAGGGRHRQTGETNIEERLHIVMKLFINQNSSSSLTGRLNHRTLLEYISWGGLCKFILSAATFSKV